MLGQDVPTERIDLQGWEPQQEVTGTLRRDRQRRSEPECGGEMGEQQTRRVEGCVGFWMG